MEKMESALKGKEREKGREEGGGEEERERERERKKEREREREREREKPQTLNPGSIAKIYTTEENDEERFDGFCVCF
jgi:hypothetical protein